MLRAYYQITKAELRRLEGDPRAALAILDRIPPLRRDAPLVAHESARIRARAYWDLGHHAEAHRNAKTAMMIAQDHGWPHRARQVATEFPMDTAVIGARHRSANRSRGGTTGGPQAGNALQRLAALEQVGQAASRVLDPSELARIALDETIKLLAADRAFLFLTEGADNHLVSHLGRDSAGRDVTEVTEVTEVTAYTLAPGGVVDHLLRAVDRLLPGQVRMVRDDGSTFEITADVASGGRGAATEVSGRVGALAAWLRGHPATAAVWSGPRAHSLDATLGPAASWLVVPLAVRGQRLGAVVLCRDDADYDTAQTELAAALATQAMVAYDNAQLFAKAERMATLDSLTGLPNRRAFFDYAPREVRRSRATGRQLGALMIDIDHFKRINDTYGHQTGDEVLQEVAGRLAAGIRAGDLLARYGGEEFVVLLLDADDEPSSHRIEQLRAEISSSPVDTQRAGPVLVTISIGMAHMTDDDDLEQLLVRADAALYRAKRNGRDRLVVGAP